MPDWATLLPAIPTPTLVHAETFVKKFGTASAPVLLACDEGDYVVKSRNAGRMIVTDQMVGRVGVAMSAPCATVALVEITQSFIDSEPQLAHMAAGIAHGSRWIPNCSDQKSFEHTAVFENRDRFARLALLFGLALASDHQFIYEDADPYLVWSMDHGHFFAGSTAWTSETLRNAPIAETDGTIVGNCTLTDGEITTAKPG